MEIDYVKLMASKTDQELDNFISLGSKFFPAEIQAAIAEMQKRGRVFSSTELSTLLQEEQAEPFPEKTTVRPLDSAFGWQKNIVDDENAPAYYSDKAIQMFSIGFSVFFGAVLMAINLNKVPSKNGKWGVIAFGIVFTSIQIWTLSMVPNNAFLTILTCYFGSMLMNHLFWKKYIGTDTKYRAKPIWKPLVIGIMISLPVILAIIYGPR
jgi:hypothetical protein